MLTMLLSGEYCIITAQVLTNDRVKNQTKYSPLLSTVITDRSMLKVDRIMAYLLCREAETRTFCHIFRPCFCAVVCDKKHFLALKVKYVTVLD